jgi:thioredoxin 1
MAPSEFIPIADLGQLRKRTDNEAALLVWFTGPGCRICIDLKPKVAGLVNGDFPEISLCEVDCERSPDVAAQYRVFTVPTLLLFFRGQEFLRKGRNFSLHELRHAIERPYRLLFQD